jgi:hypothetical protein
MAPKRSGKKYIELGERIGDLASFRRKIHVAGNLSRGISETRASLAPDAVPHIVSTLLENTIYRAALVSEPFPKTYTKIKSRLPFRKAPAEIELVWAASILRYYAQNYPRS